MWRAAGFSAAGWKRTENSMLWVTLLTLLHRFPEQHETLYTSSIFSTVCLSCWVQCSRMKENREQQRNSTLWVALLTLLHRFPSQHDTPSTNAPIIETTTNRCRDTAFYSYWLAFEFPWWKERVESVRALVYMICIKCLSIKEIKIYIFIFFLYQILTCCRKAAVFTVHCVWVALSITIVTFISIGDNSGIYRRKTQLPLQMSISADFTIPERQLSSMFFGG